MDKTRFKLYLNYGILKLDLLTGREIGTYDSFYHESKTGIEFILIPQVEDSISHYWKQCRELSEKLLTSVKNICGWSDNGAAIPKYGVSYRSVKGLFKTIVSHKGAFEIDEKSTRRCFDDLVGIKFMTREEANDWLVKLFDNNI